jgi:hypothetical protein
MTDVPEDSEFELDDVDDEYRVGAKVLEMAERPRVMDRVAPGSVARWSFSDTDDGTVYDLAMTVRQTPPPTP